MSGRLGYVGMASETVRERPGCLLRRHSPRSSFCIGAPVFSLTLWPGELSSGEMRKRLLLFAGHSLQSVEAGPVSLSA